MPELHFAHELLSAAAPILDAARGDEARMKRLRTEPLQVLSEAGIQVPDYARASLPQVLSRVIDTASAEAKAVTPVASMSMATLSVALRADPILDAQVAGRQDLQQELLACSQRAQALSAGHPAGDFALPLEPRTALVMSPSQAPVGAPSVDAQVALVGSTSVEDKPQLPGATELARLRGQLAVLRAGFELCNEPTMVRLSEDAGALIKAIEAVDQPQRSPQRWAAWIQTTNAFTQTLTGLLERARTGDFLKNPMAAELIDRELSVWIQRLYDARGAVWMPPDVAFSTHWHGMVLTLSSRAVKDLAMGVQIASLVAKGVGVVVPPPFNGVLKLVEGILNIYSKLLPKLDRGNGVYLTCCWWSLPPLMMPPSPFFPTPV